jgi:hypothetical protein
VIAAADHIPLDVLLQDWLGESDAATGEAVDTHLMACDACGALLDDLLAFGAGVRGAVLAGAVALVTGPAFLGRVAQRGLRVREYRVDRNGSVNCTVAPQDQVLVSRLQAPLGGVQRLDVAIELSIEPGVLHRLEDIPFDPAAGEVLYVPSIAQVRTLPAHSARVTLLARDGEGSREIGHYVFNHTPSP